MKLMDRHLIRNYLFSFAVLLMSTFGLFVVSDLFDNVDDFRSGVPDGDRIALVQRIAVYYAYQSCFFLNGVGHLLIVLSLVVTLIVVKRGRQLIPFLASGIPLYRCFAPIVVGAILVDLLITANREFVLPHVAHHRHENRGKLNSTQHDVRPVYDQSSGIFIGGKKLLLEPQRLDQAQFVLPAGITETAIVVRAPNAVFKRAGAHHAEGWLLRDASPSYQNLRLTQMGRKYVKVTADGQGVFITTPINAELLYARGGSAGMQSTAGLLKRIRSPSFALKQSTSLVMEFHRRLLQPMVNVLIALAVCIFALRRDSRGVAFSAGISLAVGTTLLSIQQLCTVVGSTSLIDPKIAAWAPVLCVSTVICTSLQTVET